ncbi:MAG: MCE family protein [Halieaceae bacterium]|nr:MCE family protein [Halieaceae bacterium]
MNEKSHNVLIGAFIVGALIIALSGIIFLSSTGFGTDRQKVVMVFDGSVKGLTLGAPIALRGVQIGQVTDIRLILDTDTIDVIMLVESEINSANIQRRGSIGGSLMDELIARGMRAQLNTQSFLTGLLYVQLDFFPDSDVNLAAIESEYPQIPTIPTELQRLQRQIESIDIARIAEDIGAIADGVNQFVNNPQFQQLPEDVQAGIASFQGLSSDLRGLLASTGPRVDTLLDNATETFESVNNELPELSRLAKTNLAVLDEAIIAFESAMQEIDGLVSEDSNTTYELNRALRELAEAGRALQLLAKTLEQQPEALIRGKREEDQ